MRFFPAMFSLTALTLCLSAGCTGKSHDLDAVISAAQANDEYVVSGKGTVTYEDFMKKSPYAMPGVPAGKTPGFEKVDADCAFDGEKRYSKFFYHGRGNLPYEEAGYDGEQMWRSGISLDAAGEIAVKRASKHKKLSIERFDSDRFDPRFTGLRVMNNPVGAILASACADTSPAYRVTRKPKLLKDEVLGGVPCKVITFAQKNSAGQNTKCTLWLAPSLRYRAARILLNTQSNAPLAGKEVLDFQISYRMLEKEIPFPKSIELRRTMNGHLFMHRKTVFHPDWQVNIPIPDSLFQFGKRSLERKEWKVRN